jgi:hypothetical protein
MQKLKERLKRLEMQKKMKIIGKEKEHEDGIRMQKNVEKLRQ